MSTSTPALQGATLLARFDAWLTALGDRESHPHTKKLFRIGLHAWLFASIAVLLPAHADFWGKPYIVRSYEPANFIQAASTILNHPAVGPYYPWFLAATLCALTLSLLGYWPRLMNLVALVLIVMIKNRTILIYDAGNNLSWLAMGYLLFVNADGRTTPRWSNFFGRLDTSFSNVAFFLLRAQLCTMYLVAGLCKLVGPHWQQGLALFYTLQVDATGRPGVADALVRSPWLLIASAYGTIVFQLAFPGLVWVRKARPVLFAIGAMLHVSIGFVMGLPMFGLVMIVAYSMFFTDDWSRSVLDRLTVKRLRALPASVAARLSARTGRASV